MMKGGPKSSFPQKEGYNSDGSENDSFEDDCRGALEIDLDYGHTDSIKYISDNDEPLDLSIKRIKSVENANTSLDNLSSLEEVNNNNDLGLSYDGGKGRVISHAELEQLLSPYLVTVNKRTGCSLCHMRFPSKEKALAHIENKHLDCLQYKCPLCKTSKTTKLSLESHMRRGHNVKVTDYSPVVRLRKNFDIKNDQNEKTVIVNNTEKGMSTKEEEKYDFEFIIYLREMLNIGISTGHGTVIWIDQDQGIFSIIAKEDFLRGWATFKGLRPCTWDDLHQKTLQTFMKKNILKQLHTNPMQCPVFQILSIKKLLV